MKATLILSKQLLVVLIAAMTFGSVFAAESFISFTPVADAWQLKTPSISLSATEHSCVQTAAQTLIADFEKVTGTRPQLNESDANILIGTVGASTQIDQWVKQGLLADLKDKLARVEESLAAFKG